MGTTLTCKTLAGVTAMLFTTMTLSAEPLPRSVQGAWHITRVIPTKNPSCWSADEAQKMIGTTLVYREKTMTWRDGDVALEDITTRTLTSDKFREENGSGEGAADFDQLGIRTKQVLEVDMQHEDMNITGATTEVPGDSVLVVSPSRIIVSACGVYFEATRGAGNMMRVSSTGAKHSSGR